MQRLAGRIALLTGASRGIGPHIARALAREGVHMALVARSASELEALASEIRATGVRAMPIATDLADAGARAALVARVESEVGPIDILVNNAGTMEAGPFHEHSAAQIEHVVRVNLVAPMDLARVVLPEMIARGRGHLVHVASLAGKVPLPWFTLYSATKYGLVGFNQTLQSELRGTGVRSSAVCPGMVSGDGMWARASNRAHFALGMSAPRRVAGAVVDVLLTGAVERIVNPMPVRPVVALWGIAPAIAGAVYRAIRIAPFARRAAAGEGAPAGVRLPGGATPAARRGDRAAERAPRG